MDNDNLPMEFSSRAFAGEDDVHALSGFLIAATAAGTQPHYWHVGDLMWRLYQNTIFDPYRSIRLWEQRGELVGFTWLEEPDGVSWQIHPSLRGGGALEEAMLMWAEEQRRQTSQERPLELWTTALESEKTHQELLLRHGFTAAQDEYLLLQRNLSEPIPAPELLPGFSVRHVGGEDEWQERVDIHREVWHPSKVTLDGYERLRAAPGYIPELDLVTIAPDGTFASYCICWLDPINRWGEFEPVGTRPAFRGLQLGRAVVLEGLHRLREHAARSAYVACSSRNQAAARLYESVGFRIYERDRLYMKTLRTTEGNESAAKH